MKGPIAWMTHSRVVPNLLMILLLIGGLCSSLIIKKEVFPDFELDIVSISVAYPGSSPEEVEQGIVLAVEEAVKSIEGIEKISSTASEGNGRVIAELLDSTNPQKVLQEIKQEIDRITTFPEDAEEPVVSLGSMKRDVLKLSLYGDASELVLRELGEQVRDRLLQQEDISQVSILGAKDLEIHVEISTDQLRAYGLSMASIAAAIDGILCRRRLHRRLRILLQEAIASPIADSPAGADCIADCRFFCRRRLHRRLRILLQEPIASPIADSSVGGDCIADCLVAEYRDSATCSWGDDRSVPATAVFDVVGLFLESERGCARWVRLIPSTSVPNCPCVSSRFGWTPRPSPSSASCRLPRSSGRTSGPTASLVSDAMRSAGTRFCGLLLPGRNSGARNESRMNSRHCGAKPRKRSPIGRALRGCT